MTSNADLGRRGLMAGAVAWPLVVRAQQPATLTIGFLSGDSLDVDRDRAFLDGLNVTGYASGKNITVEYRWAAGNMDLLPAMAADLAGRQVRVIATRGNAATLAAKAATAAIPVVFTIGSDPVGLGIVSNLNRPGGNLTGVTLLNEGLTPKRLELLHALVPGSAAIVLLVNPSNPNAEPQISELRRVAQPLGRQIEVMHARTERDCEVAFAAMEQRKPGGLVIGADSVFNSMARRLGELSLRHALPAVFQFRDFVEAGGLMSYSGSTAEAHRWVGIYCGRILNGEKPGDLPIHQPAKIELIVNLRTARALGVTIPLMLHGRADEMIE
ncbi:MAG TPA: ABC transporter substrate-binding protein [Reyranellaceae bacterium]|nr:ABC transporter substrate-binding protein [Reyranellaceae bacterium]